MLGLCGAVYLLFGSKANAWDEWFDANFNPAKVTWQWALVLICFGFGMLTLSLWIWRRP